MAILLSSTLWVNGGVFLTTIPCLLCPLLVQKDPDIPIGPIFPIVINSSCHDPSSCS